MPVHYQQVQSKMASQKEKKSYKKHKLIMIKTIFHHLKFIYSEKATKFCKISTVNLSYVVPVEISQNCVAFLQYMNFNKGLQLIGGICVWWEYFKYLQSLLN